MPSQHVNKTRYYASDSKEGEQANSVRPKYKPYVCGLCGTNTTGRVVCDMVRGDQSLVSWCLCACEQLEPTVFIEKDGQVLAQLPNSCEFRVGQNWPPELAKLFEEASKAYAAGAYTAASMVCRKLLMNCACHENAAHDLKFFQYVDYIVDEVLLIPRARDAINAIKEIGNEANHEVQFVSQDGAKRAMQIVTYMLNTVYSLPAA